MESLKHLLHEEGCSSSESGWTMYISSPMEEDFVEFCNYHDDEDDNKSHFRKQHQHYGKKKEDEDSDDSLASDASSGPSHYQHIHILTVKVVILHFVLSKIRVIMQTSFFYARMQTKKRRNLSKTILEKIEKVLVYFRRL